MSRTYVLNDVVVDLGSSTLCRRDGSIVTLRPQSFAMLSHLIANPDRVVTKNELIEAVWHGAFVTDDSLVQCAHEIRRSLNDHRRAVLQTAPRRGYRLVFPQEPPPAALVAPSVAVLPFRRLGRAVQAHLADALTEDLAIGLSKIRALRVVARRTGSAVDHRDLATQLGVRYLVGGSVRKTGHGLRITAELIDGASGAHIWAGSFDGSARELFERQDRLIEQIVGVIEPSIRRGEIERAQGRRPADLGAYDLYLRAVPHALANTKEDCDKALTLLDSALKIDPGFLPAHGHAAWCREQKYLRSGFDPSDRAAALMHADIALGISSDDPQVISIAAFVRANLTRDYDAAIEALDRALAINANSPLALGFSALVSAHSERHARAVEHAQKALRLSPPDDPMNYHPYCALSLTNLFAGHFAEAARYASLAIVANPGFSVPHAYLVASLVGMGDLDAAQAAARRLLALAPTFTVRGFVGMNLFREALMENLARLLANAQLPPGAREEAASSSPL